MPNFKHFLITRFNLKRVDWSTNKRNLPVLTTEWHDNRFKLFMDFCFPSVNSQINKNFEWLVFFDNTTDQKYRELISSLQLNLPNFKPFFIDGMDSFLPELKKYISHFKEDFIITSGLDNDDCLSKYYIEEIQKKFDDQEFIALDFVDGYTIQTQGDIKIGKKLHIYNPFISLIEKNKDPQTVCNVSHRMWKKESRIEHVKNNRIWASVIHHENKVNEFTGYGNVNLNLFLEEFKIAESQNEKIKKLFSPVSEWKTLSYMNTIASYWTFGIKKLKKSLGLYN